MYSIYNFINILPFSDHGWFPADNQKMLERLLQETKARIVIEVGSWFGLSTRFIANHLPEDGVVLAVDPFTGGLAVANPQHPDHDKITNLYQQFLSNVYHARLTHKIIPIRMKSDEAASALDVQADVIYIDGMHTYDAVYQDLTLYSPKLTQNGVVCGDDWTVGEDLPVQNAVKVFAKEHNLIANSQGNFWWFSKA